MYEIDFSILLEYLNEIANGIKITVFICLLSSFFAFIFGSFLFYLRQCGVKILRKIVICFVELYRNTPLLIQLYILYKGLPQLGIVFSPITCGIITLSIYTGVYISENIRSGKNSIQPEQKNAALALGLSPFQTFLYVIYPQALRHSILPLGSQFINLIKNSALVSFISVTDIFYVVYQGIANDFRIIEFIVLGVCLYSFATLSVSLVTNLIEAKLKLKVSEIW